MPASSLGEGTTGIEFKVADNATNWGYSSNYNNGAQPGITGSRYCNIRKDTQASFGSGGNIRAVKVSSWEAYPSGTGSN